VPVKPPVLDAPPKFDPAYVTEDDLDDLASYTGLDRGACLQRLRDYSPSELGAAWRRVAPRTQEEILDFYRSTDMYIWDLMQWHASNARRLYWQALAYVTEHYPADSGWGRVCDFGCGIGTDALFLASHGYAVTLVDVDSAVFRFARHRFERRGLKATFVESQSMLPALRDKFDVVLCFDVFEHLPDPLEAARRLVGALRDGGLLVQQGSFADSGDHPCHLADGVVRFSGLKWHIHLAGYGMRTVSGLVYRKTFGIERLAQHARYQLWRATGAWLLWVRS
jgi:SAM-dependent methyltransferase